ncbi:hypothetical protein D3C87_1628550 [compost metagenome]
MIHLGLRLGFADLGLGTCHFETPDRIQRGQSPVVRQFFTRATAGRLSGIELRLIGRAIEPRQGIALLERFSLTKRQLDNPPRHLTGQYGLVPGPQYTAGLGAGRSTGACIHLRKRVVCPRRLRLDSARDEDRSQPQHTENPHDRTPFRINRVYGSGD